MINMEANKTSFDQNIIFVNGRTLQVNYIVVDFLGEFREGQTVNEDFSLNKVCHASQQIWRKDANATEPLHEMKTIPRHQSK